MSLVNFSKRSFLLSCATSAIITQLLVAALSENSLRSETQFNLRKVADHSARSREVHAKDVPYGVSLSHMIRLKYPAAALALNSQSEHTYNVLNFGAKGDGTSDDTSSIKAAFDALSSNLTGGVVYFPTGRYLITSTISIENADSIGPFTISGDGMSSVLLWSDDTDLLSFQSQSQVSFLLMQNLMVASTNSAKSATSAAFRFTGGLVKSHIAQLTILGQGNLDEQSVEDGLIVDTVAAGTAFDLGNVTDTVSIRDTVVWGHTGDAVRIGKGSEVRISGGRFIAFDKSGDAVGIHVTGNNGGVHVWSTDLIGGHIGMLIDSSNGAGSNREIFITHATMDSNWRGLAIADDAYVSVTGCWTASNDQDNIWISPESTNAQLVISGGTIYNAGAEGGDPTKDMCNGVVVNAGSFQITGTSIRNNKGRGVWTPSAISDFTVTGCRIFENGQGMQIAGSGYVISSNSFNGNTKPSDLGDKSGGAIVANNANPGA